MATQSFRCPICDSPLSLSGKSYLCSNKHCFDIAKSGYVNLLPSNKMHSKLPGDNKQMVDTRNRFLSKNYYEPLQKALCEQLLLFASQSSGCVSIVDAGCGEGYYTTAMCNALLKANVDFSAFGIDISKCALELASKKAKLNKLKNVSYAVASVFDLPLFDNSCDILTVLFAPFKAEEYRRALRKEGIMLLVIPAKNHLIELKQEIYDSAYENEVKPYEIDGFELLSSHCVTEKIKLTCNEDILDLFSMTPYCYKTSKQDADKLKALTELATTIDFVVLCYKAV